MAKKRACRFLGEFFEIPREVVLGLPRIVLRGCEQLTVENYEGVRVYTPEKLIVKTAVGEIEITGKDFILRSLRREEVVLEGRISALKFWFGYKE